MDNNCDIPKGCYCYDVNGVCPYWKLNTQHEEQNNGYCSFLKEGDWDNNSGFGLLWDQVKLCNINTCTDEELLEEEIFESSSDICNLIKDNGGLT